MRLLVLGLAIFGLVSLFSSGLGAAAGVAALLLAPLLIIAKLGFFLVLFGVIAGCFGRRHSYGRRRWTDDRSADWTDDWNEWRRRWSGGPARWSHRRREPAEPTPTDTERFEEWHRMAHAKKEVDSWVDPQLEE